MIILPPQNQRAVLTSDVFDLKFAPDKSLVHANPYLNEALPEQSRRRFLSTAAAAASGALLLPSIADAALVFKMDINKGEGVLDESLSDKTAQQSAAKVKEAYTESRIVLPDSVRNIPPTASSPSVRGQVPADFWERPRALRLKRQGSKSVEEIYYWRDGKLDPDGYWRACHVLRDVRAGKMTYIDPALLDLLRGITGYYEAWDWNHPIIITSGYRTSKTNNGLTKEGSAKNSTHLYGKAADLYMEQIPVKQLQQLGKHFKKGGVGFYPGRGFIHLDTGNIRSWQGK